MENIFIHKIMLGLKIDLVQVLSFLSHYIGRIIQRVSPDKLVLFNIFKILEQAFSYSLIEARFQ